MWCINVEVINMGRNISGGLISEFQVVSKGRNSDGNILKEKKEELLKCLKEKINLDFFEVEETDNRFYFKLKEEPIKKYFVDYMKEFNTFDDSVIKELLWSFYGEDYRSKTIDDIDGKIKLVDVNEYGREYVELQVDGEKRSITPDGNPFFPHKVFFLENFSQYRDIDMDIYYLRVSFDYSKYDGESERYICSLLINLVRKAMKNPLKDITFFCISG